MSLFRLRSDLIQYTERVVDTLDGDAYIFEEFLYHLREARRLLDPLVEVEKKDMVSSP